jgi:hypothetical protein
MVDRDGVLIIFRRIRDMAAIALDSAEGDAGSGFALRDQFNQTAFV